MQIIFIYGPIPRYFPSSSDGEQSAFNAETQVRPLEFRKIPWKIATQSNILA